MSLVPVLSKRIPEFQETHGADPDSERIRLFSAVVSLLESASADQGMLLVLDDLHWADKGSLQLMRHVVCSSQLPKVMVLGTYRDSELSAGNALSDTLASLRRARRSIVLQVSPYRAGDLPGPHQRRVRET